MGVKVGFNDVPTRNAWNRAASRRPKRRTGYSAAVITSVLALIAADYGGVVAVSSAPARHEVPPVLNQEDETKVHQQAGPPAMMAGRAPAGDKPKRDKTPEIPAGVLDAYRRAESALSAEQPGCHLRWQVLAGIGKVESGHARGGRITPDGDLLQPILGPVLDGGEGVAAILNTYGGRWNQAGRWARAAGPMQFIPSTWEKWGSDGNGDGRADPQNVHDAALAAGKYLCAGDRDLERPGDLAGAVLSYNNSAQYLRTVLRWIRTYDGGVSATNYLLDAPILAHGGSTSEQPTQPAAPATEAPAPPPAEQPPNEHHEEQPVEDGNPGEDAPPPAPPAGPPPSLLPPPVENLLSPLIVNGVDQVTGLLDPAKPKP